MRGKIAVIIPTYKQLQYAGQAVLSLFEHTENAIALVVDDGTPGFHKFDWIGLQRQCPKGALRLHHYDNNHGLTRSWNYGLRLARDLKAEYTVAGNSDILFTPGWELGLLEAVESGTDLVGPLSNAPGTTNPKVQDVAVWLSGYQLTDDREYLASVASRLRKKYKGRVKHGGVNGFFMFAKTSSWWSSAFNEHHVFHTGSAFRLTRNEDELQKRWRTHGLSTGIALSSFIFHYRAVSRGGSAKKGKWYRIGGGSAET